MSAIKQLRVLLHNKKNLAWVILSIVIIVILILILILIFAFIDISSQPKRSLKEAKLDNIARSYKNNKNIVVTHIIKEDKDYTLFQIGQQEKKRSPSKGVHSDKGNAELFITKGDKVIFNGFSPDVDELHKLGVPDSIAREFYVFGSDDLKDQPIIYGLTELKSSGISFDYQRLIRILLSNYFINQRHETGDNVYRVEFLDQINHQIDRASGLNIYTTNLIANGKKDSVFKLSVVVSDSDSGIQDNIKIDLTDNNGHTKTLYNKN